MPFDIHLAVRETKTIATFMKLKFAETMWNMGSAEHRPGALIPYPEGWSLEFAIEVDLAVSIIAQAFDSQGTFRLLVRNDTPIHV
jgi:hypothetical protein